MEIELLLQAPGFSLKSSSLGTTTLRLDTHHKADVDVDNFSMLPAKIGDPGLLQTRRNVCDVDGEGGLRRQVAAHRPVHQD